MPPFYFTSTRFNGVCTVDSHLIIGKGKGYLLRCLVELAIVGKFNYIPDLEKKQNCFLNYNLQPTTDRFLPVDFRLIHHLYPIMHTEHDTRELINTVYQTVQTIITAIMNLNSQTVNTITNTIRYMADAHDHHEHRCRLINIQHAS